MDKDLEDYKEMICEAPLYDLILLCDFGGKSYGDVMTTTQGLYNSLIDMGKAMPVNDPRREGGEDNNQMLINTARNFEKENEEFLTENIKLMGQIRKLEDKLEIKEKILKKYKNKMLKEKDIRNK